MLLEQFDSDASLGPGCLPSIGCRSPRHRLVGSWWADDMSHANSPWPLLSAPPSFSPQLPRMLWYSAPRLKTLAVACEGELLARGRASFFLQRSLRFTYFLQAGGSLQFPPQVNPLRRELTGKIGPRAVYRLAVNISSVLQEFPGCCILCRSRSASHELAARYPEKHSWMAPEPAVPPWLFRPLKLASCL